MFLCIINIQWLELKTSPLIPCGLQCTNWARPPDVLSNHKLVISIQLAVLMGSSPQSETIQCFHDHKVERVSNNVHIWSWTCCNPVLDWQRTSCTCGFVPSQGHLSLFTSLLHSYTRITRCQASGSSLKNILTGLSAYFTNIMK